MEFVLKMCKPKFFALFVLLIGFSAACTSSLNLMSNYYSFKTSYSQSDPTGFDYFKVSSSGSTLGEFRTNSKAVILRQLIYEGFVRQGVKVNPILTSIELQERFRANENEYLNRLIRRDDLIEPFTISKGRKLDGGNLYQAEATLVIDRDKLEVAVRMFVD